MKTNLCTLLRIPSNINLYESNNKLKLYKLMHKNLPVEFRDNWLTAIKTCTSNGFISQFINSTRFGIGIGDLINASFIWSESIQGHEYWKNYRNAYNHVYLDPKYFWNSLTGIEIVKFKI